MTKKLLMGNEAMAYAALEAGVGVVAGYPGTPSSEIVETVARQHERGAAHGVHVEWSTNEKVALELLFGASLAGRRCLFTCKQMGLNVASDALMSLNYVSVRGGLVLVVADDPGPISSQTEQDTRRFAMFAKVPVLDPATPEQAYQMVKAAFDLSEHYHTPVIVRPTTRVDHASSFFDVPDETFALATLGGGFLRDPSKWVIFPRRAYEAHGEINTRLVEMAGVFSTDPAFAGFNRIEEAGESFSGRPTFGIMAGGVSASYVREALRTVSERVARAGIGMPAYRFMQVGTPYPFPEQLISRFVTGLSNILVVEELDSVLEDQLAMYAGRSRLSFTISGKLTGDIRDRGENDVDDIIVRLERFLGLTGRLSLHRLRGGLHEPAPIRLSSRDEVDLPSRPPVLCAGCPHRGAFYAVKQAVGDDSVVMCGDIGCYTLGNAQPLDAVDTCLCMGAGITMAQGIVAADADNKAIAYVGDSTFFASGMPGLANAAYNGHDITVMVLDNSTTAMTGGQPHPGIGRTLMGKDYRSLDIESVLVANGFGPVYHANPFDRDASVIAVRAALSYEGPSAVIFEGPCVQLVKPKPAVVINHEVCTGCKRCITEIGCPAISFSSAIKGPRSRGRGQATVDVSLCTGCGLCTQVCPFHAIQADPSVLRNARASRMLADDAIGRTRLAGARRIVKTEDVFGSGAHDAASGSPGEAGALDEEPLDGALDEGSDSGSRFAQLSAEVPATREAVGVFDAGDAPGETSGGDSSSADASGQNGAEDVEPGIRGSGDAGFGAGLVDAGFSTEADEHSWNAWSSWSRRVPAIFSSEESPSLEESGQRAESGQSGQHVASGEEAGPHDGGEGDFPPASEPDLSQGGIDEGGDDATVASGEGDAAQVAGASAFAEDVDTAALTDGVQDTDFTGSGTEVPIDAGVAGAAGSEVLSESVSADDAVAPGDWAGASASSQQARQDEGASGGADDGIGDVAGAADEGATAGVDESVAAGTVADADEGAVGADATDGAPGTATAANATAANAAGAADGADVAFEEHLALEFGDSEPVVEVQPSDEYDEFDAMFDAFKDEPSSTEEGGSRD